MPEFLDPLVLKNGLIIRFFDQSNRYFGDFHRIFIKVQIALPDHFELTAGLNREKAYLERSIEKMGVTSAEFERERNALIDAFLATSKNYFEKDDFPKQLSLKLLQRKQRPVFQRNQWD